MKKVCKICLVVLLTALLFDVCFLSASADQEPEIYGKNALCINMESGKIFYEKNAGKTIAPASFTKIMTAVLALEYQEQYAPYTITVTNRALSGTVGNKIGFKEGEILAYEDLLAALIIANSNDAAHILAEEISGSIPAFVIKNNIVVSVKIIAYKSDIIYLVPFCFSFDFEIIEIGF